MPNSVSATLSRLCRRLGAGQESNSPEDIEVNALFSKKAYATQDSCYAQGFATAELGSFNLILPISRPSRMYGCVSRATKISSRVAEPKTTS